MFNDVKFFAKAGEREALEPICSKCGRLKDEEVSELDYTTKYVCYHCDNSAKGNLSVREIKGFNFD